MAKESTDDYKICGIVDYSTGIVFGLFITFTALLWVYLNLDEEERVVYFMMGGFNLACLGMTYVLRIRLDSRLKEKQAKKEKEMAER